MFFERPEAGSRALLIVITGALDKLGDAGTAITEFEELVFAADLNKVAATRVSVRCPVPATYLGKGKLDEIKALAETSGAELILINKDISPGQERNLEKILGRRVVGRTGLILEIFARRARTHEGKLQVELAQLSHASTRLVKGWSHLDRQRGTSGRGQGSFAGLGGAGEKQLEADQRLIQVRINRVNRRLEKVRRQGAQNRNSRVKAQVKTVSLVGYTNAGKSTLFNRLCETDVYAANQLFATLDPTLRKLKIEGMGHVILSDTVGFISELPHTLIDAFRATLEEVKQADLLLHVVDASAAGRFEQMQQVNKVLGEIDAEDVKQLIVYNKIDLTHQSSGIERNRQGLPEKVRVSALNSEGLDLVRKAIGELLSTRRMNINLVLKPDQGAVRARLFELGAVRHESVDQAGSFHLQLCVEEKELRKLLKDAGPQSDLREVCEGLIQKQAAAG